MNTEHLRNFIAIVETGSITAAAQKQAISQPTLSGQLKQLEESVGYQLIIRNTRNLQLTDAGRLLYKKAQKMIRVEDSIFTGLYDVNNGLNGTLHLGVTNSFSSLPDDRLLINFLANYPSVKLNLYEGETTTLIDWLSTGVIDVALLFNSGNIPNSFEKILLYKESLCIAYPDDNFWELPNKEKLDFSDLKDIPLAMTRGLRDILQSNVPQELKQLNCRYFTGSRSTTIFCARDNLCLAMLPASEKEINSNEGFIYKAMDDIPFSLERCCLVRAEEHHSSIVQSFIDFLRANRFEK